MKLKTLILLNEFNSPGSLTSGNSDFTAWDGVTEGNGWFSYSGNNHHNLGESYCTITITEEDKPHKYWAIINTKNLKKSGDSNDRYHQKIRERTKRATHAWVSAAKKLHKEPKDITECGNLIMRNWKDSFKEALNNPRVKLFMKNVGEGNCPILDPVNFTPRV